MSGALRTMGAKAGNAVLGLEVCIKLPAAGAFAPSRPAQQIQTLRTAEK